MTRAILFANATLTSIAGLRAIMLASHEPAGAPFRAAQRTTELAPMMSRRRSVRGGHGAEIEQVSPARHDALSFFVVTIGGALCARRAWRSRKRPPPDNSPRPGLF